MLHSIGQLLIRIAMPAETASIDEAQQSDDEIRDTFPRQVAQSIALDSEAALADLATLDSLNSGPGRLIRIVQLVNHSRLRATRSAAGNATSASASASIRLRRGSKPLPFAT